MHSQLLATMQKSALLLTGANHGQGEDKEAFCSGGDQRVRGNGGYVGDDNIPRLNVLDFATFNPHHSKTCYRYGKWFCHRWWTCIAHRMRPLPSLLKMQNSVKQVLA